MSKELQYSANLTGAPFLFYELKQVIGLKLKGIEDQEVRRLVLTENLFQYQVTSSLKRSLPSVIRRANILDQTLQELVVEQSMEAGRIINLYAIMKTERLFFEFMDEVIREKLETGDCLLEKKDVNLYFASKVEQDAEVAKWTDNTIAKLKSVMQLMLCEAGILKDRKTGELNRLFIDEQLKQHLIQIGDIAYVRAMGEV